MNFSTHILVGVLIVTFRASGTDTANTIVIIIISTIAVTCHCLIALLKRTVAAAADEVAVEKEGSHAATVRACEVDP